MRGRDEGRAEAGAEPGAGIGFAGSSGGTRLERRWTGTVGEKGSRQPGILLPGVVALLLSTALAMPARAADDVNPEIANCEDLRDEATVEQANACKLHVFCGMVFRIQRACTKAKTFLNRLKDLSFRKDRFDSSDVFDAAAPSTEGDASFNRISAGIKGRYDSQPRKEILTGHENRGGKEVKWVYEGPVKDGKRDGTGVLVNERGEVFRGDFAQDRQNGMGDQFFERGDAQRWAGQMNDQLLNGRGVMRFPDGSRYEGEFQSSRWEGRGTYVTPDGIRMEGDWKNGKMNGRGAMTAQNGNRYEGDLVDGKRHGRGTLAFPNGDQFSGTWVHGVQHGPGTYRWADGDRFEGEYRDGKRYSGTTFHADGTRTYYANGARSDAPPPSAPGAASTVTQQVSAPGANLNGSWQGQGSGNRVRIQSDPRGILVTPITRNPGQSNSMLYLSKGQGGYRLNLGGGGWSEVETLSPDRIRVRNSDGWSDVFTRSN